MFKAIIPALAESLMTTFVVGFIMVVCSALAGATMHFAAIVTVIAFIVSFIHQYKHFSKIPKDHAAELQQILEKINGKQ